MCLQVSRAIRLEDAGGVPPPNSRVYPVPGVHRSKEIIAMTVARNTTHVRTVFSDREKRAAALYLAERAGPEARRQVVSLLDDGDVTDPEIAQDPTVRALEEQLREAKAAAAVRAAKKNTPADAAAIPTGREETPGDENSDGEAENGGEARVEPPAGAQVCRFQS